ncbi:ABC transporter ATP-binding protein, partial [Faecalibacterium prausnitzii]
MMSLNPLLLVGGVIGTVSVLLLIAYACVKDKKTAMGFERSMADGEILRRLFGYAKPYLRQFVVVGFLVLFSISYDIASPLIVGYIEELVVGDFELKSLYVSVAVGEAFNVGEKVFTQIGDDALAHTLQNDGLQIG